MRRSYRSVLVALSFLLAAPSARSEPIVVDQSFAPPFLSSSTGISLDISVAQTFTAGLKGQLTSASVAIVGSPPVSCSWCFLDFEIRKTVDGAPSNSPDDVLAHIHLSTSDLPRRPITGPEDFYVFDLGSMDVFVSPGDQLAMVFNAISSIPETPYRDMARVRGCNSMSCQPYGDPYTGGEMWFINEAAGVTDWTPVSQGRPEFNDVAFQTFVRPGHIPEPSIVALLSLGLWFLPTLFKRDR